MDTRTIYKISIYLLFGTLLSVALNPVMAAPLKISQAPLTIGASKVLPNIMLMIDNSGSMDSSITLPSATISPTNMPAGTVDPTCSSAIDTGATTPTSNPAPPNIQMTVTGSPSTPKFCATTGNNSCANNSLTAFATGTTTNAKCFNNTQYYNVNYNGVTTLGGGPFTGAQLNWYFAQTGVWSAGSLQAGTAATSTTRMIIAKNAAKSLVNALIPTTGNNPTVRLGLTTFNANNDVNGGRLLQPMADLTVSHATKITADIGSATTNSCTGRICPDAYTPLAETLADIGRYFCTGNTTTNLTLHPANIPVTTSTASIADVFNNHTIQDCTGSTPGTKDACTGSTLEAPIKYWCQKNAVILVTDGLPNKDRAISPLLTDYRGECANGLCDKTATTEAAPFSNDGDGTAAKHPMNVSPNGEVIPTPTPSTKCKESLGTTALNATAANTKDYLNNLACKNGTKAGRVYEKYGSDYLDDVAKALFDMDLRPDMLPEAKNNIATYAVGIADPVLNNNNSVLRDAALITSGPDGFQFAENEQNLLTELKKMVADIKKGVGSFSAIVANSTQLGANTAIFQAKYDTTNWTGDFLALPLDSITGNVQAAKWNAGVLIPAWNSTNQTSPRNIYTYNANINATSKGISFKDLTASAICNTPLTEAQQKALGISNCNDANDEGLWRLDYLRGDIRHEQINFTHKDSYAATDPRLLNTTTARFRSRTRFNDNNTIILPDPWLLGDIVNSDAAYVSNESFNYNTLTGLTDEERNAYQTGQPFITTKNSRAKMIYVGANDAMLHGFNASLTDADAGKEMLAYMPNSVFSTTKPDTGTSGLQNLSSPDYVHQYFVDGSPRVGDVYFGKAWHTVLVGTTGAGGKSVFALDVTDPSTFATTSPVLWEISNAEAIDMGYTLPQVSIGRMHDGSWAAIVANGYGSTNNKAVLYIINIETGAITKTLDTLVGSVDQPNGLSTPIATDVDHDGIFDAIYAGDLLGNMWKFDVSDDLPSKWAVAYTASNAPAPLFTACSDKTNVTTCNATRQPITNKPQVGKMGQATGVMVFFGTGKYIEDTDNDTANTKTQSFYGILDECALASSTTGNAPTCSTITPDKLVKQSIIAEETVTTGTNKVNARTTSNNTITYSATQKGWYIDFVNPKDLQNHGERIVSASLLRNDHIVFVTLIPVPPDNANEDPCKGSSISWLMELNALSGSRLGSPVFDITGNGIVNNLEDTIGTFPVSGIQLTGGSVKTPAIIDKIVNDPVKPVCPTGFHPVKGYTAGSEGGNPSGELRCEKDTSGTNAGRQSWRQL